MYWRMSLMDDPGRYHLLLHLEGGPSMHGWWNNEDTAERMFRSWIGTRGRPGARITLTDTIDGRVIHSWSAEA